MDVVYHTESRRALAGLIRLRGDFDPAEEAHHMLLLFEKGGETTATLTILHPSKEAREAALGTGTKDGASASFDRFAEYLRTMA